MTEIQELSQFLALDMRLDVKALALQQTLGLTGTTDGRHLLINTPCIVKNLCQLLNDGQNSVAKDASLALINLSADEEVIPALLAEATNIVEHMLKIISNPEHNLADPACMVLSNLTRTKLGGEKVFQSMEENLDKYIDIFCQEKYNKKGARLHYLASVLSNLSQLPAVRSYIFDPSRSCLQRLVSFTDYKDSISRRGAILGLIKNCCFETDHHEFLLSEAVDLLPKLLIPLAGPEEFDEEDNDKLPIDLQYLGEEKTREPDPDIRKMLLEALTQLCATKFGREYLRSKNTYVILRELHKWEKNENVLVVLEHLVNILIRFEHEIGHDNLKELEVPDEITEKFNALEPAL
uniref:Protein HGH1 homolog n=1 Tax=Daphnia similis TaxID=35528 RepID=A0A4Y7LSC0_9CRUS|nr:EOG090X08WK [Daphnia similis]SVE71149.1 EOG090X08WK [Daphnia similis]SVE71781.1 EOG090X08WK [Daphnia similis]SVE72407.1 EOG090X08WK [Daphnia similis]